MIDVRDDGERVSFSIRVTPRSPRTVLGGAHAGALRVRVTAAPVAGAANDAVVALLADALGVARGEVRIEAGAASRTKRVSVPRRAAERLRRLVGP